MIWLHYVGGFYTRKKFIAEVKKHGVSRRIAPNLAKFMAYGDVIKLLDWNKGQPLLFAEFVVSGISMDAKISEELAPELIADGKARLVTQGGNTVVRECGSYVASATYEVDVELSEVVERADEIAARLEVKPNYMITGHLSRVYDPPEAVEPPPKFSRGFLKTYEPVRDEHDQTVQGVIGYSKRTRRQRDDLTRRLPNM
jgi:hypothetical protein